MAELDCRFGLMPTVTAPPEPPDLESVHRLHAYCARFPSEIAETAIRQYTVRGDSIYDPFCGSGTSLTAGLMLRRHVVGSDVDVLAGMLSAVKCTPASGEAYQRWRSRFDKRIERAFTSIETHWPPLVAPTPGGRLRVGRVELSLPGFPELNYWF